jgi:hypothetical protein
MLYVTNETHERDLRIIGAGPAGLSPPTMPNSAG